MGQGVNRAKSLLLKRLAFRHEAEIRIILISLTKSEQDTFVIDINPNKVFDEVRFDPRLAEFERREREKRARDLGYRGSIDANSYYQRVLFQVPISKHWDKY